MVRTIETSDASERSASWTVVLTTGESSSLKRPIELRRVRDVIMTTTMMEAQHATVTHPHERDRERDESKYNLAEIES